MKKNKIMRLASCLLVAVLLTTCAISGTFAKYVTSGSGSDTARVAKFGVAIEATGDAFKTEYEKDTTDESVTLTGNTVVSTEKVIAPGTEGTLATVSVSGQPEVAVRVAYSANFTISDNWSADNAFYCPLIISVGDTEINGAKYDNKADFVDAVNAQISTYAKDYGAGANLNDDASNRLDISWKWPFSTSDENDRKDTDLGNQAVVNNAATVTLGLEVTVTQID